MCIASWVLGLLQCFLGLVRKALGPRSGRRVLVFFFRVMVYFFSNGVLLRNYGVFLTSYGVFLQLCFFFFSYGVFHKLLLLGYFMGLVRLWGHSL